MILLPGSAVYGYSAAEAAKYTLHLGRNQRGAGYMLISLATGQSNSAYLRHRSPHARDHCESVTHKCETISQQCATMPVNFVTSNPLSESLCGIPF